MCDFCGSLITQHLDWQYVFRGHDDYAIMGAFAWTSIACGHHMLNDARFSEGIDPVESSIWVPLFVQHSSWLIGNGQ